MMAAASTVPYYGLGLRVPVRRPRPGDDATPRGDVHRRPDRPHEPAEHLVRRVRARRAARLSRRPPRSAPSDRCRCRWAATPRAGATSHVRDGGERRRDRRLRPACGGRSRARPGIYPAGATGSRTVKAEPRPAGFDLDDPAVRLDDAAGDVEPEAEPAVRASSRPCCTGRTRSRGPPPRSRCRDPSRGGRPRRLRAAA